MNEKILTLLNEVRSDIKIFKNDVNTLKDDVHDLKNDVSTLKDDVHDLKNDVNTLKTEQAYIKNDISTLKTEQANIKIAILDLRDTGEKVDSLTSIQEGQQHIIDLLSTRSIEQEADIKELKLKTS